MKLGPGLSFVNNCLIIGGDFGLFKNILSYLFLLYINLGIVTFWVPDMRDVDNPCERVDVGGGDGKYR